MKILSLELYKCSRLSLSRIKKFRIELHEVVQLILGTNGSGKSSILYELSPLPAQKESYEKDGRKAIEIEHNGAHYTLVSDFGKTSQPHSFVFDGIELNEGGNVTMQRELVYTHFGINAEIHEILIGQELFTNMSPSRRREWFTKLCTVDYGYAIRVYKKTTESLRDTGGALKLARKRIAIETANAVEEVEAMLLRERLSSLTEESRRMYMLRNSTAIPVSDAISHSKACVELMDKLCSDYKGVRRVMKNRCYIAPSEFEQDVWFAREKLAADEAVYQSASSDYMTQSAEIAGVEGSDSDDVAAMKDEAIAITNQIKSLRATHSLGLTYADIASAIKAMDSVYEHTFSALTELPASIGQEHTKETLAALEDKIRALGTRHANNTHAMDKAMHRESHLLELMQSKEISCPKCTHSWRAGYNEHDHRALKEKIEKGRTHIEAIEAELKVLIGQRDECNHYLSRYGVYANIRNYTPALAAFWSFLHEDNHLFESPTRCLGFLDKARKDLETEKHILMLQEQLKFLIERTKMAEVAQSETFKEKKKRLLALEEYLGSLVRVKARSQELVSRAQANLREALMLEDITDRIRLEVNNYEANSRSLIDSLKNDVIDAALRSTHEEIAVVANRINTIDTHASLIADIALQISELEKNEIAYKVLAECLSPTDGLIAEGMLGFIRNFVARMNSLIAQVWSYPMEVKDCSLEEDSAELNYKFPMIMEGHARPVPDVSKGSSGMIEIVNLAFRLVAAQCLRQDAAPLALDEFGKTFDEAHREAATQVVRKLVEQLNHSQLFMISHYEDCYGAFYNAQVTVVDKRNITVPNGMSYNKHTLIETA